MMEKKEQRKNIVQRERLEKKSKGEKGAYKGMKRIREEKRKRQKRRGRGRVRWRCGGFVCLRISVHVLQGQISQVGSKYDSSLLPPQAATYKGASCPPLVLVLQLLVLLVSCLQKLICLPFLLSQLPGELATKAGGHQPIRQLLPSTCFFLKNLTRCSCS